MSNRDLTQRLRAIDQIYQTQRTDTLPKWALQRLLELEESKEQKTEVPKLERAYNTVRGRLHVIMRSKGTGWGSDMSPSLTQMLQDDSLINSFDGLGRDAWKNRSTLHAACAILVIERKNIALPISIITYIMSDTEHTKRLYLDLVGSVIETSRSKLEYTYFRQKNPQLPSPCRYLLTLLMDEEDFDHMEVYNLGKGPGCGCYIAAATYHGMKGLVSYKYPEPFAMMTPITLNDCWQLDQRSQYLHFLTPAKYIQLFQQSS